MPVALITGASRGLGLAIARALDARRWNLIVDGRDAASLHHAMNHPAGSVTVIPGDVADPAHRAELARASAPGGRLDLLVNNASTLGPSPMPPLERLTPDELERIYRVNAIAPLAIIQLLLPSLESANGIVVNVTSDAGVEAYPGWGGYGSSKAALDRLTAVLAAEHAGIGFYAFDPGDMRTAMHQDAYPGEDISDRPEPETVVPAFLRLIDKRPPSGRYRASDLAAPANAGATR